MYGVGKGMALSVICGERERRIKEESKRRLGEVKSKALEEEKRRKGR